MARGPFRHILTLVDGTEASMKAAKYAIELAKACRAKLTGVGIVDTATLKHLLSTQIMVAAEMEEYEHELEESARGHLAYFVGLAREGGVAAETVLIKGSTHSAMLAEPKVLVNFLSEEQAVLYGFGALGLLRYKYPESVSRGDVNYDTDTGVRLSGGVGVHWFFQGLPNLGFSAEFGGMYETLGDDQFLGTFGGMLTNFGIHYYFSF